MLFETAFEKAGLLQEMLPPGILLSDVRDSLMRKVYHARCGAIFKEISSTLRTKSSVSLRGGLKALSAIKKSAESTQKEKKSTTSKNQGAAVSITTTSLTPSTTTTLDLLTSSL